MNSSGFTPWPEHEASRYRAAGLWQDESIYRALARTGSAHPERVAVTDHRASLSYAELIARSHALASAMAQRGLESGDRAIIQLPNCNEFVVTLLACCRLGVEPVMALPAHRQHELNYLVDFANARACFSAVSFRDFSYADMMTELLDAENSLEQLWLSTAFGGAVGENPRHVDLDAMIESNPLAVPGPAPSADAVALYLLSGGTTGLPKLIPRTHNDYLLNARTAADVCELNDESVYLTALPAGHNFPLACPGILGTLLTGGHVVMAPSPNAAACFKLMHDLAVTATALVPAVALAWMDHAAETGTRPEHLRLLQVGGSVFAPEAASRVQPSLGCTVQQVFGMAEGLINMTRLDDPLEVLINTQGRPMCPDDAIRVVDPDGNKVGTDVSGELLTHGPYTLRGYFNAPEHNARSFTGEGLYRTGDVVRMREDGNLVVEGRTKDLINRGGEKISAEEIENLVLAHPSVFNAAAIAMPDERLGERIALYAVLHPGTSLDLDALIEFLRERQIAAYKLPERLEVIETMPLTNIGKVDKKGLRDDIVKRMKQKA